MLKQALLKSVKLNSGLLYERVNINRNITLMTEYNQLSQTGRLYCMKMDWQEGMPNRPHYFWDSDIAKWIEACAYSLEINKDNQLEKKIDEIIDIMGNSQQEDGYLNTYFQTVEKGSRFTNLKDRHELYCAGHLIEAACAYYITTKKDKFLNIMIKYSDLIYTIFGPNKGQLKGYPGHEEIELALVRLYNITNNINYLNLAEFFVLERGKQPHYYDIEKLNSSIMFDKHKIPNLKLYAHIQAHEPIIDQITIEGHSVRALYYLSGAADIAYITNNIKLIKACKRLYENIVNKKMYITGGIGSSLKLENFSFDYDLPNETAYAETCAAIALVFFTHRMFLYEKKGKYIDVLEKVIYNGILSGVSLDGTKFFYSNPLEVNKKAVDLDTLGLKHSMDYERKKWFGCACCPPNVARLLASITQYIYATDNDDIYVNLYTDSTFTHNEIILNQITNYPWEEYIKIDIHAKKDTKFKLFLRIPSWCNNYTINVNSKKIELPTSNGYICLERQFSNNDEIILKLNMPIVKIQSNPHVRQNANKLALQRGPIIYCLEQVDNNVMLSTLYISKKDTFHPVYDKDLLGGCTYIEGTIHKIDSSNFNNQLYKEYDVNEYNDFKIKAIPYSLWTNRAPGDMLIWINKL